MKRGMPGVMSVCMDCIFRTSAYSLPPLGAPALRRSVSRAARCRTYGRAKPVRSGNALEAVCGTWSGPRADRGGGRPCPGAFKTSTCPREKAVPRQSQKASTSTCPQAGHKRRALWHRVRSGTTDSMLMLTRPRPPLGRHRSQPFLLLPGRSAGAPERRSAGAPERRSAETGAQWTAVVNAVGQ